MLVLDASAVIAWAYDDEVGLPDAVMERVGSDSAAVPTQWILEVTNSLLVGERRGRLKPGQRREILTRMKTHITRTFETQQKQCLEVNL